MAGFESACHINGRHERLDMIAAVGHDTRAAEDYRMLAGAGFLSIRDVVRWHLVDRGGALDFSSFLPMLEAANSVGLQVIWNLMHYGVPDGLDPFSPAFITRFAAFAKETARLIREHSDEIPFYTPVNEISFFTWAGARNIMFPFAEGRDDELKAQLVLANIAACEAIWEIDPRARIAYAEPAVHVVPPRGRPDLAAVAERTRLSQFEAWDMVAGRVNVELGGALKYLDIIGLNFYHSNQWEYGVGRLAWEEKPRDSRWRPFQFIIEEVWKRYQRPLFISETSHVGIGRAEWILEIAREVYEARMLGVSVEGVCLFPILDRFDWENHSHWHNSGLWDLGPAEFGFPRIVNRSYAEALQEARRLLSPIISA